MEKKMRKWPWLLALCLCICIAAVSVVLAAFRFAPKRLPEEPDYAQLKFQQLFDSPDWQALYALSGNELSSFEDEDVFARYMEKNVGDQPLTYQEVVSASQEFHRYLVYAQDVKLAVFTLRADDWSFNHINFETWQEINVRVQVPAETTVFVNGIALDESYLVYTMDTKAEKYLPDGLHGLRLRTYEVRDLLMQPIVTATDAGGSEIVLSFDAETNTYSAPLPAEGQITQAQHDFVAGAATADAMYALARISNQELAKYIDSQSDLYKMLTDNPRNLQKFQSATVENVKVSEFCQYSDSYFSANVTLKQVIIRTSGTRKVYYLDKTYFFRLNEDGEYRVVAYTTEHVTEAVETVKLTFMAGESPESLMVDIHETSVTFRDFQALPGFSGWATQERNEDGSTYMLIRIDGDGNVLGQLEPMVLYAIFPIE